MTGQFLGIYHSYGSQGVGRVKLATSTNLLNWTFFVNLDGSSGSNTTQPTILAVGTGFMAAWEKEPNNHVKIAYYGPYAADILTGSRTVVFRMLVDNNTANNKNVVALDVYNADSGTMLASQVVSRRQWSAANSYQNFSLAFFNPIEGQRLEFRVYLHDKS